MDEVRCCPYCDNEMEKGYINNPRTQLVWKKNDDFLDFRFAWTVKKGEVNLGGKYGFLTGAVAIAYKCEICEKVIIDYSE